MNSPTVILPYLFREEIQPLLNKLGFDVPYIASEDIARMGSDLMYNYLWNQTEEDIIILHSDMLPIKNSWYEELCAYASKYQEAGIIGCKLLYPATNPSGKHLIQSAGGKFTNGRPDHFGSGLDLSTGQAWKEPEADDGQYDKIREVAWTTFGGVYIKREVLKQVGDFDPSYEHQYNRDVDYCLKARKLGWKIIQVPIEILHYESKDNKRIRDQKSYDAEARNLLKLQEMWQNSTFYATIDRIIE